MTMNCDICGAPATYGSGSFCVEHVTYSAAAHQIRKDFANAVRQKQQTPQAQRALDCWKQLGEEDRFRLSFVLACLVVGVKRRYADRGRGVSNFAAVSALELVVAMLQAGCL